MPAALISQMDPPSGERDAFERWYAEEHVPLRMALPGFRGAVRGWAVQGEPSHLVVYWMDGLGALETPEYRDVKERPSELTRHMLANVEAFTRWLGSELSDTGEAPPGRFLYLVTFDVPDDAQEAFDDWYEREHVPMLMESSDWSRVRRYAIADGEPAGVTRVALHELASLDALASPEREAARATEWRARLAENEWFGSARYAVYERHQDFDPARAG
jgi:hypothetical protein